MVATKIIHRSIATKIIIILFGRRPAQLDDLWKHSQQGSPCTEKSISMMEDCHANEGTQRINMRKVYCLLTRLVDQCSCSKFKGLGCIFGKEYNILSQFPDFFYLLQSFQDRGVVLESGNTV